MVTVETPIETIPVFQRGGSAIPRKMRMRRSSSLMKNDPYTLMIALDDNSEANGFLYVADGHSFQFEKGVKTLGKFVFDHSGNK